MPGQMCWLPRVGCEGDKMLHLRTHSHQPWKPYTSCPEFAVPDYRIAQGSKGWATYQKLIKANWALIPTDRAMQDISLSHEGLEQRIAS